MALPGLPNWRQLVLAGINAPVTPANLTALDAWQRAEGGTYANNPFNTTLKTPYQIGGPNSAGVRGYSTPQAGIQATIDTLLNTGGGKTYSGVLSALRSGSSARDVASAIASSPWGTGSGVLRVLGSGPVSSPSVPVSTPSLPTSTSLPVAPNIAGAVFSSLGQDPSVGLGALVNAVAAARSSPPPSVPSSSSVPGLSTLPSTGGVPSFSNLPSFKAGSPIPVKALTSVSAEHPTEGLAGFPAHDYMAAAGTPVLAPVGGTIVKLSGHDPSGGPTEGIHGPFGWSVYVKGNDGHTYYLTHLGSRDVQVGQKIGAGSLLGTVGDYARWGGADHVHMGVD